MRFIIRLGYQTGIPHADMRAWLAVRSESPQLRSKRRRNYDPAPVAPWQEVGDYRRHLKTIGCLGQLDALFGTTVTTRSLGTVNAMLQVLRCSR